MIPESFRTGWRSTAAGAAFIIVLTILAYLPVRHGGFIFDDAELITDNRIVKASDGLYRFWFTAEADPYYPLSWSLWWLEWRLWDGRAAGYHVVNVLLHAVNAVLVWMILRRLKVPGAWLAAAVFAIHPVNVATAAWISEQKNTLSMLFYALSILFYLRFDEDSLPVRTGFQRWRWYGFSLGAFLLALLSKTAVVMLPVVLLGCVWWQRGRLRWQDWLRSVPYFLASLTMALVIIVQHQQHLRGAVERTGGFAARLAVAGLAPWFYLSKALVPINLMVIYPKWDIDPTSWVLYVPGIILIGSLVVFWCKRNAWGRPLLFGLGYFVGTLFPVLGFFDQSFYHHSLVADHWQYYSIVGVIALLVAAGQKIGSRIAERGQFVGMLAPLGTALASVGILVLLGVATWRRSCVYADAETLWRDNLAKNPNAWAAHSNLGLALSQAGKFEDAIGRYEQALRIAPALAEARYNLGVALTRTGKLKEAIVQFEQALRINPDLAEVHNDLAIALVRQGKVQEAVDHWKEALRIKPDFADACYSLGLALLQQGQVPEAVQRFAQTLQINPNYAEAYYNLGLILSRTGYLKEAIGEFEQAVRINPELAEAQNNLAVALVRQNRPSEAVEHFEQALRLKPNDAATHYNLGSVLIQLDRMQDAMVHWQQALEINPELAEAHNNLGLALCQSGELPGAIKHFEHALRIKPDDAATHYNLGVALERAGKPDEAIQHFEQALRIDPNMAEAQNRLARLRAGQ